MILFRKAAGLACALAAVGLALTGGQAPKIPGRPLPGIPGIPGIPVLETPAADGPDTPRAMGVVDQARLSGQARILNIDRIWDQAPHNAFTDLIRFKGRWYCTFREGAKHVSPDGAVRVITSSDGVEWVSVFHIKSEYADMRDPKLSITSDNRLMLSAMAAYNPPTEIDHQTLAWYTLDGRNWGRPFKIGDPETWLWRVTWYRGSAYSMAYSTTPDRYIRMYVGQGGLRFKIVSDRVLEENFPSEATLLFNRDDSALCLLRRDGKAANSAELGYGRPPYRGWEWRDLGIRLGGPNMIRIPDGRIVAAGRIYEDGPRTALCWLDETEATLEEFLSLPSGGDNSYPGLVFYDNTLWVSYYSSHEGKASIYLAKVKLPGTEEKAR